MWIFGKKKKNASKKSEPELPKSIIGCGWCGNEHGVELIEKLYQEQAVTRRLEMLCPDCSEKFKQECGYGHTEIPCQDGHRDQIASVLRTLSDFELKNSRLDKLKELVLGDTAR